MNAQICFGNRVTKRLATAWTSLFLLAAAANAQDGEEPVTGILQTLVNWFAGPVGTLIVVLAIIGLVLNYFKNRHRGGEESHVVGTLIACSVLIGVKGFAAYFFHR